MSYQAPAPRRRRPAPSALPTAGQGGAGTRRPRQTTPPPTRRPALSYRWPAAQPDQVKPENGHHNMMARPALSPLPAVSPTPVAATEGREAAAAGLGRLFVHRATPGARKAGGARQRRRNHRNPSLARRTLWLRPAGRLVPLGTCLTTRAARSGGAGAGGPRAGAGRQAGETRGASAAGTKRAPSEEGSRLPARQRRAWALRAALLPAVAGGATPSHLGGPFGRLPVPGRGRPRRRRCPGRPRLLVGSGLRVRPVDAVCQETGD